MAGDGAHSWARWIRIADNEPDVMLMLALAVIVEVIANRRHNYVGRASGAHAR